MRATIEDLGNWMIKAFLLTIIVITLKPSIYCMRLIGLILFLRLFILITYLKGNAFLVHEVIDEDELSILL